MRSVSALQPRLAQSATGTRGLAGVRRRSGPATQNEMIARGNCIAGESCCPFRRVLWSIGFASGAWGGEIRVRVLPANICLSLFSSSRRDERHGRRHSACIRALETDIRRTRGRWGMCATAAGRSCVVACATALGRMLVMSLLRCEGRRNASRPRLQIFHACWFVPRRPGHTDLSRRVDSPRWRARAGQASALGDGMGGFYVCLLQ